MEDSGDVVGDAGDTDGVGKGKPSTAEAQEIAVPEPFVEIPAVEGGKGRPNLIKRKTGVAVKTLAEEMETHSQNGGMMARFENKNKTSFRFSKELGGDKRCGGRNGR